jgi:hypothetical protein
MSRLLALARARLTYANVTATLALFVALGGTTYAAAKLPRNSVGTAQLRPGAVHSTDIADRTVRVQDIAVSARGSLRGRPGPTGPAGPAGTADRAAVDAGGGHPLGTARTVNHTETAVYTVGFTHDVSQCVYSATLAAVQNGPVLQQPPAGRITVASAGGANVLVKTYDAAGNAVDAPFHLLVSC